MTLAQCPSCSHGVSTQARHCPNCGHPLKGQRNLLVGLGVAAMLVVVLVLSNSRTVAEQTMPTNLYAGTARACAMAQLPSMFVDALTDVPGPDLIEVCSPTWFMAIRHGFPRIGDNTAVVGRSLGSTREMARLASIKTDIRNYMTAQEGYFSDFGTYGASAQLVANQNFTLSSGNRFKASVGMESGYLVTVENLEMVSSTNSCKVKVGMDVDPRMDGVIQCP